MTSPSRTPLVALIGANLVSTVGGSMSLVALPWLVYATTNDPVLTGVAATCEFAAVALASLFAGSVVALLGPRGTRVASDLVAGLAVLAIPALYATSALGYPVLLALVSLNGLVRTPAVAASFVMLADAARRAGLGTEAVSGPYLASLQVAQVIGAPAAGTTIALVGAPWALVVDAATFLVSGALIAAFLPAGRRPARAERASLRSAVSVVRTDRLLLSLLAISFAVSVALAGWGSVLAPVYGQTVLHSAGRLAAILTTYALGAIAGSTLVGALAARLPRRALLSGAVGCGLIPAFSLIALRAPVTAVGAAMLVAGFGIGIFSATFVTIEYERIPPAEQGHAFGLVGGLGTVGVAIGPLLAGGLLTVAPLGVAALLIAVLGALAVVATALTPGLRRPDRGEARREAVGPARADPP